MTGGLIRLLQLLFSVNMIFISCVLMFTYYMNTEIFSQYSTFKLLIEHKSIFKQYILESELYIVYLSIFYTINIIVIAKVIKNFTYLNLPYSVGLYNQVKQLEGDNKKYKVWFDRYIKKKECRFIFHPDFEIYSLYFKNWVGMDLTRYEKNKRQISQSLGWNGEIEVKQWGRNGVELLLYRLPTQMTNSIIDYKDDFIDYGLSPNGKYKVSIDKQTSLVCVGESGSGKSNFMHHLLRSLVQNKTKIDQIELIDLKGTELYRYRDIKYMNFVDTIENVLDKLLSLKEEMTSRFDMMKEQNIQLYEGNYRFVIIDEIGTIGTYPDKKVREQIFTLLIELLQKGRAAKIIFFIFAQKITSDSIPSSVLANIQGRILMKTDSDFNVTNTIGKKEDLEKLTIIDPDSFPKGRALVKYGYTSEKILIQVPFVNFKTIYK